MSTSKNKGVTAIQRIMKDGKWRTEESIHKLLLASYIKEAEERAKADLKAWFSYHLDSKDDFGLRMKEAGVKKDFTRYTYWKVLPAEEWFVSSLSHLDGLTREEVLNLSLERGKREMEAQAAKEAAREERRRETRPTVLPTTGEAEA